MNYTIDEDVCVRLPFREKVHAMMTYDDGDGNEIVRPVTLEKIVETGEIPRIDATPHQGNIRFSRHVDGNFVPGIGIEHASRSFAETLLDAEARRIGSGFFNNVYGLFRKGQQEPHLVLKVMDRSKYAEGHVNMFEEPVILHRLQGFDWVCNAEYFWMYAEEGSTLCSLEEYGGKPLDELEDTRLQVSALVDVLYALEDMHRRGMYHRDVKPGNVLARTDAAGVQRVKLIDFNISSCKADQAKERDRNLSIGLEQSVNYSRKDTTTGCCKGTIGYMSPNAVRGLPITPIDEVFSVGVMLYNFLTGNPRDVDFFKTLKSSDLKIEPQHIKPDIYDNSEREELTRICNKATMNSPDKKVPMYSWSEPVRGPFATLPDQYLTALQMAEDLGRVVRKL